MIKKMMNNEDAGSVMLNELEAVKVENVIDIQFISVDGFQTVSILIEDDQKNMVNYQMRATKGYEIHSINQVLKSFNLGITVEFINYYQYKLMIDYCMKLIVKAKQKATA